MMLLAIETACAACSAALWSGDRIAASRRAAMRQGHVEAILPMVTETLAVAEVSFAALDAIAVTNGPGSFTGLRTGLATARGLALAHGLPLIAVTTLEAVAFAARRRRAASAAGRPILAVLDTRRSDLYVQRFAPSGAPEGAPSARSAKDAAGLAAGAALAGDGARRVLAAWRAAPGDAEPILLDDDGPDAAAVAEIAAGRAAPDTVAPLYLHPPEARRPAAGGRLRP